ncbi:ATP-binding response regulator [Novosphingobium umbonatum]|nr:ATP-binding protein [Novosphingobium umbonatum]
MQATASLRSLLRSALALLPDRLAAWLHSRMGQATLALGGLSLAMVALLGAAYVVLVPHVAQTSLPVLRVVLGGLLAVLLALGWGLALVLVQEHQSRRAAMREVQTHVTSLRAEVDAHQSTLEQLRQAKESAEAASLAKSRYLISVSHEIRSPLNSIYGYAQLMERGHDIAPLEAAKIIRRSSEHLTNLVEGLLDISHVESGVLRLSKDTVRLKSFLDQLAKMFRPQAQSKGLVFNYETSGHLPDFVGTDQKRLRQILINLLSNAIKFTKAGHVTFRVAYRAQLVTFTIADSGIGIPPKDLDKLFAPFERGSHPEAQRQKGIGLGLAISQALVHILGGDLSVESEEGEGTTFTVKLMLGPVAAPIQDLRSPQAITGFAGPSRSVLLIDDDPDQLGLLRGLLEPLGFTIMTANDGDKGLALARQHKPELVLLDVTMPGLSGWEVARRLRDLHGADIRIVMVSGDAHEIHTGSAGFVAHDQFLIKPVDLDALIDVVGNQLELQWQGATAEEEAPVSPNTTRLPAAALPFLSDIENDVRIGHVRGIERSIRALEQAVPETKPLATSLLGCLDRFDLSGLATQVRAATQDLQV